MANIKKHHKTLYTLNRSLVKVTSRCIIFSPNHTDKEKQEFREYLFNS